MSRLQGLRRKIGLAAALALLVGCGGSSGGGGTSGQGTGSLSIAVTDAPVDDVDQVVVEFTGIELKPRNGSSFAIDFEQPLAVDLGALNRGNTEVLLNGAEVPAGEYNWIRLKVNAEFDNILDSYVIEDGGGQVELRVPSGSNSGLKLVSGFTVVAGNELSFVIDWNLRAGLVRPPGQPGYKLKPALRIVDMQDYGAIAGTVDVALVIDPACSGDPNTLEGNSVYIYPGSGVVPDDIDGVEPEPLTIADLWLDSGSGNLSYRADFLPPGPYSVAFTCQAGDDQAPDEDDPALDVDDPIIFTDAVDAVVVDGQDTAVNF